MAATSLPRVVDTGVIRGGFSGAGLGLLVGGGFGMLDSC